MAYRYKNPWAGPTDPADYSTTAAPLDFAGCLLFHVLPKQWDVVKSGVCIAQRVTKEAAEHAASIVSDLLFPTYNDVRERMFAKMEEWTSVES